MALAMMPPSSRVVAEALDRSAASKRLHRPRLRQRRRPRLARHVRRAARRAGSGQCSVFSFVRWLPAGPHHYRGLSDLHGQDRRAHPFAQEEISVEVVNEPPPPPEQQAEQPPPPEQKPPEPPEPEKKPQPKPPQEKLTLDEKPAFLDARRAPRTRQKLHREGPDHATIRRKSRPSPTNRSRRRPSPSSRSRNRRSRRNPRRNPRRPRLRKRISARPRSSNRRQSLP